MRPGQSLDLCDRRRRFLVFLECLAPRFGRVSTLPRRASQRVDGRLDAGTSLSVQLEGAGTSDPSEPFSLHAGNSSSCSYTSLADASPRGLGSMERSRSISETGWCTRFQPISPPNAGVNTSRRTDSSKKAARQNAGFAPRDPMELRRIEAVHRNRLIDAGAAAAEM
jgi:hypothetical protein